MRFTCTTAPVFKAQCRNYRIDIHPSTCLGQGWFPLSWESKPLSSDTLCRTLSLTRAHSKKPVHAAQGRVVRTPKRIPAISQVLRSLQCLEKFPQNYQTIAIQGARQQLLLHVVALADVLGAVLPAVLLVPPEAPFWPALAICTSLALPLSSDGASCACTCHTPHPPVKRTPWGSLVCVRSNI